MRHRLTTGLFLILATPALLLGQSLTEVAKEEKERRKKNKEAGQEVQVITDRELVANQGRIANPGASAAPAESTEAGTTQPSGSTTGANETGEAPPLVREDEEEDEGSRPVTEIPADASLEQKLSLLERMKASYQQQVGEIDAEIQENNQRLAEIEKELVSTGGTGLPTAPQADRAPRNPGNIPGLQSEQQGLRQRNQTLEAQKQSSKDDIIARARRAGIPASYLNF